MIQDKIKNRMSNKEGIVNKEISPIIKPLNKFSKPFHPQIKTKIMNN